MTRLLKTIRQWRQRPHRGNSRDIGAAIRVLVLISGILLVASCTNESDVGSNVTQPGPKARDAIDSDRARALPPAQGQDTGDSATHAANRRGTATPGRPDDRVAAANQSPAPMRPSAPTRRGGRDDITFDDLQLDLPAGTLFEESKLTERARQLDGQEVRIRGFIFAGGVFQQTGITSFPLVKNTKCKFGPQGLAYCVILVELDEGVSTHFTTYPITVEGKLTVQPFNSGGFTWSVYHLRGHRVY